MDTKNDVSVAYLYEGSSDGGRPHSREPPAGATKMKKHGAIRTDDIESGVRAEKKVDYLYRRLQHAYSDEDLLEQLIRRESQARTEAFRRAWQGRIQLLLIQAARHQELIALMRQWISRKVPPEDIFDRIRLVEILTYHLERFTLAKDEIEKLIPDTVSFRRFRRHALAVKARIAIRQNDLEALDQALRDIMALDWRPDDIDIGRERDIIDTAPEEFKKTRTAEQYEAYLRA